MFALLLAALAAAASGPDPDPAAQARAALEREALEAMNGRPPAGYDRPWHWLAWMENGPGSVGRLHDYCTGAVEPKPRLAVGREWTWESLDPRALSASDREAVKAWRYQFFGALYACGTVFEIGDTGAQARRRFETCDIRPADAFTQHVTRNPSLRDRDDYLEVTVEAMRNAGCR